MEKLPTLEIVSVGLDIGSRSQSNGLLLLRQELDLQLLDDGLGDFVLDRENVGQIAVEAVGPQMPAGGAVDQLAGDPHPLAGLADASLKNEFHAQLGGNLGDVDRFALEGEAGVAPDHEQPADLGQIGDDVFGDPVGEIFLFGIARHIVERQHRD